MIRNKQCAECKTIAKSAEYVCMVDPVKKADIMVIGEFPSQADEESGHPFSGKQGRFFKKNILAPLAIEPNSVYFDYAVKCPTPKRRKPSRVEVLNCRPYLEKIVQKVQPKVIFVAGNPALCSVLYLDKVGGISMWRGKKLWSREFNCWIVPIQALWKVLRDKNMGLWTEYDHMIADIKLGLEAITEMPEIKPIPKALWLRTYESIESYLLEAVKHDTVAVDSETDGLDPRNEILGISLTFKRLKKYYPVYIEWKWFEENPYLATLLDNIFQNSTINKVLHNIDFDQKFFYWHKFPLQGKLNDTMMMARLLNENFSMGLKERTWTDLDFGGYELPLEQYKFKNKFSKNTSYKKIPVEVMAPYAGYDTLATYMLWEKFQKMLKDQKLWALYSKIVMPVRLVETEASINGLYVHMDQAEKLDQLMNSAKLLLGEQIKEVAGKDFNFSSTQQLSKLLFEDLKAPNGGKTKANNWKCDKAVLGALSEMKGNRKYSQIARLVLKYKYIDKAQGTYIGQARTYVWLDGRVHSGYSPAGTVTGRTSNKNPCTHNIPKDKLVRSLYGATPGNVLIEADIKAAEMRAIALESQDQTLLGIFHREEDIHNQTYNEMFGKSRTYIPNSKERRIAKSINFGLIYGITAVGLSRRLGISVDEAQKYIDMYFDRFKGIARWIKKTIRFARKHGYVVSMFGRRRRLPDISNDDIALRWRAERQAMNSPIQGEASDYTYIGLIRVSRMLRKYKLKAKIVHTVHDCIIVDTPKDEIKAVKYVLKTAFLTPVKAFPIKMDVDIEIGELWGEHNDSNLEIILNEILEEQGDVA